ncbi:unnamed protein product [Phytomonas sp. Hart1]|nr:unnamed protein product [Phytomonas sp. Hart1]|eukprot:CCW66830.1 unnamed protein product [Phytomonas sp. isolate Hart1]
MHPFYFYFSTLNRRDYPDLTKDEHDLWRPGLVLAKHYGISGIRVVVPMSGTISLVYFYLYHIRRLPLVRRPLARLGDYFYPSVAYSTPLGLLGGLVYGAMRENPGLQDDAVARTLREERHAVEASLRYYETRRSRAAARVGVSLPWFVRLLGFLRLTRDPVDARLRRMGLPRKVWQDLVEPNSLLWVSIHYSKVDDARWYRPLAPADDPCGESKMVVSLQQGHPNNGAISFSDQVVLDKIDHNAQSSEYSFIASVSSPPANPYFSKPQTDALVSRVMQLQGSPEEVRWTRTSGRFSFYGMIAMLVLLKNGNMLYRTSIGLGFGMVLGTAISATRLDDVFTHLR